MANKFAIYTLGCKVNQYDAGELRRLFLARGWAESASGAALVVINTCSVTKVAQRKNRQTIKTARQAHPGARLILAGCWPTACELTAAELAVDMVWAGRDWPKLIKELTPIDQRTLKTACATALVPTDRARYFIKIQDGCRQFCTYCLIPYARGPLQSRSSGEVLAEIKAALKAGYQEIVLSGIHLGLYGRETGRTSLVSLLKKIIKLPGDFRLRLSSIEITEVSDELIALISTTDKICRHLHISVQSGSDKILRAMRRPYTVAYFKKRVAKLLRAVPDIAISTDIIVGFPGETEADFAATFKFARELAFSKIHVFSFSAHPKTPAFSLPHQVPAKLITERSVRLRTLSDKLADNYQRRWRGHKLKVLVIKQVEQKLTGKTEYFFDLEFRAKQIIAAPTEQQLVGKLIEIRW